MGIVTAILDGAFGGGRNVVTETIEAFRPNAEAEAARTVALQSDALAQFGQEFIVPKQGGFDRFMDGVNRLPRPMLALGTLGLLVAAMVDPVWFAARMAGIALVPEPLWWLLGVIVSFYFGARHQAKGQAFRLSVAETVARAKGVAAAADALGTNHGNPALAEWERTRER